MSPRMKFAFALIAVLWLLAFFGGRFLHDQPHANDTDLGTQVSIFRDVQLKILQAQPQPGGSWRLVAGTTYQGRPAMVRIDVGAKWEPNHAASKDGVYEQNEQGQVTFRSLGGESDRLLQMLNEYYVTKLPPKPMAPQVPFRALVLEGEPGRMDKSPVKLGLLFLPKDKNRLGAFYTYIDLPGKKLTLLEKDVSYRQAILWALRGE